MLNGKSLLITGGTGSLGKQLVRTILKKYPDIKRLVIFSRDELKQYEMSQEFSDKEYPCIRYFIGDIRDQRRFEMACKKIDYIIHAAALKQVPTAEYNPFECIKTNVIGAQNVIETAIRNERIKGVVALSTDKAAAPINLYGATKLCSDKLFVAANNMSGRRDLALSVVRYGNVMGSRGSVIPFFMNKANEGVLPITDDRMTRFNISLQEGVDLVLYALGNAMGGELYVPKIPSYKITDVATAIAPNAEQKIVGIRPGEKIHEEMITESDSFTTYDLGEYYAILPQVTRFEINDFIEKNQATKVQEGFHYTSENNEEFLSVDDIRQLITENLDPEFKPV